MIHRIAALICGFDGDFQIFFDVRLPGEVIQVRRPQGGFKLPVIVLLSGRNHSCSFHRRPICAHVDPTLAHKTKGCAEEGLKLFRDTLLFGLVDRFFRCRT